MLLCVSCVCVHAQAWPTLCKPMDCSPQASSVHGIFQARVLEWFTFPSSSGSSRPRDWTLISCMSCIGRWILYHWTTWKAHLCPYMDFIYLKRLCKCYWVSWDGEIILGYSGGSSVFVVVAVQSPSHVQIFATPCIVALKTSLSLTISWNLLKFMSSAWVMPSIYILKSRELFLAVVRKRVVIMEEIPEKCNFLAFMEEGGQELRHAGGLQKLEESRQ